MKAFYVLGGRNNLLLSPQLLSILNTYYCTPGILGAFKGGSSPKSRSLSPYGRCSDFISFYYQAISES
jgi:hypothetical protein